MKNKFLLVLLFLCILSLGRAAADEPAKTLETPPKTILDTIWTLRKMQQNDSVSFEIDEDAFQLQFNSVKNKINGKAPCNTFFGGFTSDFISTIQIMAVGNTRMYCENMKFEEMFLSLLQKADTFMIKKGKLILLKGNQLLLIFE